MVRSRHLQERPRRGGASTLPLIRRLDDASARLVVHRTAREAEEETFETALPENVDQIARRIVTDLQL